MREIFHFVVSQVCRGGGLRGGIHKANGWINAGNSTRQAMHKCTLSHFPGEI